MGVITSPSIKFELLLRIFFLLPLNTNTMTLT
jgi:hypothetical protein